MINLQVFISPILETVKFTFDRESPFSLKSRQMYRALSHMLPSVLKMDTQEIIYLYNLR